MSSSGQSMTDAEFLAGIGAPASSDGTAGVSGRQDQSWLRYPKLATNALVGGLDQLVGIPGDVAGLMNSGLTAGANWLTGANVPAQSGLANSQQLTGITNALGLTNRPEAMPTTPAERYMTAVTEGAIPGLLGGPVGALAGGIGGAAGEAGGPLLGAAAGLGAGIGLGGVTGLLRSLQTGKNLASAADQAALEAQHASAAADVAAEAKRLGGRERDVLLEEHNAGIQQQLSDMGHSMGSSQSMQDAGNWLQQHAQNWIDNVLPQRQEAAWQSVNAAIPPDATVDLSRFRGALKQINSSAGELEPVAQQLKPRLPLQLEAMLDHIESQGKSPVAMTAEGDIVPAEAGTAEPATYPWNDVQKLRSTLGDAMSNPAIVKDLGSKNMSRLYATLTGDMRDAASEHGAAELFDSANKQSTDLYNLAENHIGKLLIGSNGIPLAPEKAAAQALSGATKGGTGLATLRAELPDGVNELAAAHLQNPTAWEKLSPEAKQALMGSGPQAATVDSLLGSKLELEIGNKAAKNAADDLVVSTRKSAASAQQQAAAAQTALTAHRAALAAGGNDLLYKLAGAAIGAHEGAQVFGGNPLLGALGGYAAPAIARGISQGIGYALSPNQLGIPAIGAYAGSRGPVSNNQPE